jgi:inorganic pyrophosphatase
MMKITILITALLLLSSCQTTIKQQTEIIDDYNFLRDFPTFTADNLVNVVVEIPAGTNQKWEVNKSSGYLEWERINVDSLRTINYLPYPANYGFVPQTLLSKGSGGDGDPLDVFLLDAALERGEVIPSRIIAVIKMLDRGEQDDKLIAVPSGSHFASVHSLEELLVIYPGVIEILSSWLSNYKGEGLVEIQSVKNEEHAMEFVISATEKLK